jgi:dATP/dGTP diphosphohydrolase, N-terminal
MNAETNVTTFSTGAVRGTDAENVRFDLITPIGLRRLAETCAEGAEKYGDHNWQRGIPASVMLNHAIRHIYLWLDGDNTEDHLAHACWNILGVCHFEEEMPQMIDIPSRRPSAAE